MIYPQKNWLLRGMVDGYINYAVKRNFHKVNFNEVELKADKSVLLIANHFSIWDGMLLYNTLNQFSGKNFHVMLLEDTAIKEPMLKYVGAFSIHKGNRDILKALNYAAQLLADPNNLVLIYPQGKLYSNFSDELTFEKGVLRIMERAAGKFQLIYATTFIENFNHKKPTANVYLLAETQNNFDSITALQTSYQQHYNASRQQQTQLVF